MATYNYTALTTAWSAMLDERYGAEGRIAFLSCEEMIKAMAKPKDRASICLGGAVSLDRCQLVVILGEDIYKEAIIDLVEAVMTLIGLVRSREGLE
jgi:hypothetical protein